uniref:Uncharacterized protein LOC104217733 n=1 Tax=Nicotiana sylvestris TaxID=4096 RepID=A0A1U7VN08_NICSY|nr:PREDICTED: uncharacterized protein LOC104217733 [Nicotiana sylvestris]
MLASPSPAMIPLTPPKSLQSSLLPTLQPRLRKKLNLRNGTNCRCRAEFANNDATIAVAIGVCVLSSLVFPSPTTYSEPDHDDGESVIDSGDARFTVMAIISLIPYFNWLSWVFAWLDTGKLRYAIFALVYLAPYVRSNLSLSPEDSWLPIVSILLCIFHVQADTYEQKNLLPPPQEEKISRSIIPTRPPPDLNEDGDDHTPL